MRMDGINFSYSNFSDCLQRLSCVSMVYIWKKQYLYEYIAHSNILSSIEYMKVKYFVSIIYLKSGKISDVYFQNYAIHIYLTIFH